MHSSSAGHQNGSPDILVHGYEQDNIS